MRYHCKYCHQTKATETALNRHIAHSPACFQAWQDDLVKLTSTSAVGVDGTIKYHSATLDDGMPDFLENITDDEVLGPDETVLARNITKESSVRNNEDTDDIQDVDDAHSKSRFWISYPGGCAPATFGVEKTKFHIWQEDQKLHGENKWAPFENENEWELAQWLIRNVGQMSINDFLKLPIVSLLAHSERYLLTYFQIERVGLSFHNTYSFLKKIDQLPTGPDWVCEIVKVSGDVEAEDGETLGEELELWHRNPMECIQELIGNPAFKDKIVFEPGQFFTDEGCTNRIIDEAWTADWWWKAHVSDLIQF